jgi:hypothetical protein
MSIHMKPYVVVFMAALTTTALSAEDWNLKVHFTPAPDQTKITLTILKRALTSDTKPYPIDGSIKRDSNGTENGFR